MPEHVMPRRSPWMSALLVLLPLWLLVSSGIGLWMWYRAHTTESVEEPWKFAIPVEEERLASDLRKLVEVVGPRHTGTDEGARGLRRAAAMIQGSLGPSNAGYRIELEPGPRTPSGEWPVILATLPGGELDPLWVVTAYDTRNGGVEANSTGVVSVIAVARALANETLGRPVRFAFLPHAYDADGPVLTLLDAFTKTVGEVPLVLVVESMGANRELLVSSRDAAAIRRPAFEQRGKIVGAEAICLEDDFDLASTLFELNQPAVRIATRRVVSPDEPDDRMPDPLHHAEATRKLARLVAELAE